jgi:hypothetical protein
MSVGDVESHGGVSVLGQRCSAKAADTRFFGVPSAPSAGRGRREIAHRQVAAVDENVTSRAENIP